MTEFSKQKVSDFMQDIQSLSAEKYQMVVQIRDLYLKFDADLIEDIKYGGLVFNKEKDLIGGIFVYKEHISIEFSYGVHLSDPSSVLEGKGKLRRHIKIKNLSDIKDKKVSRYVKESIAKS